MSEDHRLGKEHFVHSGNIARISKILADLEPIQFKITRISDNVELAPRFYVHDLTVLPIDSKNFKEYGKFK